MSRFLQRLAARSLGATPVLQPRRASRFEATEASGIQETTQEGTAAVPSPSPSSPAQPPVLPASKPEPQGPIGPLPPRQNAAERTLELTPQPLPLPKGLLPPSPAPGQVKPFSEEEGPREKAPLLIFREPELRLQPVPVPVPGAESRLEPLLVERRIPEVPPGLAEPSRREPRPPDLAPQRRPHGSRSPAAPLPTARPEDVHISIGRIEIRALPAAPVKAPRPSQEATPSKLDSYLLQRGRRTS